MPPETAEPHMPPNTPRGVSGGSGCLKASLIVAAVVLGSFAAMCGGLFVLGRMAAKLSVTPAPAVVSPRVSSPAPENVNRRLFRENIRWDDDAREGLFRGAVRKAGGRCDAVTQATMGAPGAWTVRCRPGYTYQFRFDGSGKLTAFARVR